MCYSRVVITSGAKPRQKNGMADAGCPCMPRPRRRWLRVWCHTAVELYEEEGRRRHRNVPQATLQAMQRWQAAGKSQSESATTTASTEGDELLRRRRQRRFSPSGRPRPGTGRRELDRQSARVRQPDVRRCNRVHHAAKRRQPQVPLVDGKAAKAARRLRLAFLH